MKLTIYKWGPDAGEIGLLDGPRWPYIPGMISVTGSAGNPDILTQRIADFEAAVALRTPLYGSGVRAATECRASNLRTLDRLRRLRDLGSGAVVSGDALQIAWGIMHPGDVPIWGPPREEFVPTHRTVDGQDVAVVAWGDSVWTWRVYARDGWASRQALARLYPGPHQRCIWPEDLRVEPIPGAPVVVYIQDVYL